MPTDIAFFLAPDDKIAAATRPNGPGSGLAAVICHDFDPEEAVVEWQTYFAAPAGHFPLWKQLRAAKWPRYAAPLLNDGIVVFALPKKLTAALAGATPGELRELAARWCEGLRLADGEDMTDDDPLTVLEGVARLAATAGGPDGGGLRLYCWYY
ncbi:hypothetical protein AB0A69_23290 [Streptomyces sp. NPDC045431]|uniref:hypothetical protein n=1 Tax=Streptomyces sp. NPDC045431 TaxID=3155613 RepID=UPI00340EC597